MKYMPTSEPVDYSEYDQEIQYTLPELPRPELVRLITREEYIREKEEKQRQKEAIQRMIDEKLRLKRSGGKPIAEKMRNKLKSLKAKKVPKPPGASSSLPQGYHEIFQNSPVLAPAPPAPYNSSPFVPLSNIFNNYYGSESYQNMLNGNIGSANLFAPSQNSELYKSMFENISKMINEKQD